MKITTHDKQEIEKLKKLKKIFLEEQKLHLTKEEKIKRFLQTMRGNKND